MDRAVGISVHACKGVLHDINTAISGGCTGNYPPSGYLVKYCLAQPER